jgi:hypothetical protein
VSEPGHCRLALTHERKAEHHTRMASRLGTEHKSKTAARQSKMAAKESRLAARQSSMAAKQSAKAGSKSTQ